MPTADEIFPECSKVKQFSLEKKKNQNAPPPLLLSISLRTKIHFQNHNIYTSLLRTTCGLYAGLRRVLTSAVQQTATNG